MGCKRCENYSKDIGIITITEYDKNILFKTYKPLQKIRFIRNKVDTIILQTESQYFSEDHTESSTEAGDCGALYSCQLENYGIYINSNIKDTLFYVYLQTLYQKSNSNFSTINPSDTISYFSFGLKLNGYNRGAQGDIEIPIDKLFNQSALIDSISLNNTTFKSVLYSINTNAYHRIKEVYFHPIFGVIKFTFFKKQLHK